MIDKPIPSEYATFYAGYVAAVPPGDLLQTLSAQGEQVTRLADVVPAERETYRYAPDKWSIREVIGHVTDAERVFGYRAFCISRGEEQPLPGFDENAYVVAADANDRPLAALVDEFALVRTANLALFTSLGDEAWLRRGVASGQPVSVRALAYIMAGHVAHHFDVLRQRYGVRG